MWYAARKNIDPPQVQREQLYRFTQDIAFIYKNGMSVYACVCAYVCVNTFHFGLQLIMWSFFFHSFSFAHLLLFANISFSFHKIRSENYSQTFLQRMLHLPKSTFTSFLIARIFLNANFCHSRSAIVWSDACVEF